jgi:SnoaL-like protein
MHEARSTIERFFMHLTARDWSALAEVLAEGVERVGPLGDHVIGRERYLEFLRDSVPDADDGRAAFARVTEHLVYPDGSTYHLEEAYAFEIDAQGSIARVEVFWQGADAAGA